MIQALEKIPTSGQYEEIIFDIDGPWHGEIWNFVLFTTSDYTEWCGHFRGYAFDNLIIAELSSKKIACIVSGGHGYIIDIDKKEKIKDISFYPISGVVADNGSSSFMISTFHDITQINNNLEEIDLDIPFYADGIKMREPENQKVKLEIDLIGSNDMETSIEYYIDLNDMKIKKHN